ncbi:MAG: hypothetical protein AMS24_03120 [Chlamydiae bacterium SM23_39]|nr:MAG: hypothetical protein AMS24_03120 [Chlamydiae bacterium SM23_39]
MQHRLECKRVGILIVFLFSLFSILIIKFYKIQIIEGEKWIKNAKTQHGCTLIEQFMRGRIYSSKNDQPLALDVLKFHLFIDPLSIPIEKKRELALKLSAFFDLSIKKKNRVLAEFYKKSRSRKIFKWIDPEKKEKIEKWWHFYFKEKKIDKNAIYFVKDYKRVHPFGKLLGQVLSTVQEEKNKDFQSIPIGGLEYYFNSYLKGKLGYKKIIRSSRNSFKSGDIIQNPENGADIYLTIDQYIQAIVEEELEKGIKKAEAKGGWAVMMDPKTGEILALAQYPFFDLDRYADYFNNNPEHTQLKAVSYSFEPGSIFKPINLAICFYANEELVKKGKKAIFSPIEKIDTSKGDFPGRRKPLKDGRVHKFLNMYQAIQKSSNVYMGKLIERMIENMGEDWYKNMLEEFFNFGKKSDIELPSQNCGLVPTPGKVYSNGKLEWSKGTPYSLAIGHNILVNSIQILRAYSIIANYGVDVYPTILKKIVKKDKNGREITIFKNNRKKKRVFQENNIAQIINAMKFTTKKGGTALRGDIKKYTEAGKTGTSEKIIDGRYSDKYYISSFVGFSPAYDAKFVLLVVIDEPKKKYIPNVGKGWFGGACAAPIFRKIGQRTLEYLGVEPDDISQEKKDWEEEVFRMNHLYKLWNR